MGGMTNKICKVEGIDLIEMGEYVRSYSRVLANTGSSYSREHEYDSPVSSRTLFLLK